MNKRSRSAQRYWRFIKTARKREKLTLPQSRALYRELKGQYERKLYANDFRKGAFKDIAHSEAIRIQQAGRERDFSASGGYETGGFSGGAYDINTLEELQEFYNEDFDYDYDQYEGTAEYGETQA